MQFWTLNVVISTKDQRLIQEIDSSSQSVDWDLTTHRHLQEGQRTEHTHYLDLNTNSKDFLTSLEKLVSLLHTIQNSSYNGLNELDSTLDEYSRTVRRSENTAMLEIVGGGSASNLSPDGFR